jgi:predicted amidohydrolase YtcJ
LLLAGCDAESPPDLILHNAIVYTVDSLQPSAEAIAIKDGRISFVGSSSEALKLAGSATTLIDAEGRLVLPGFIDTHVHPVTSGVELGECNLNEADGREAVVRMVAECATRDPSAPWVRGGGFQLPHFPQGNPSRLLLDSLVPDRPAILTSADGHNAWVNTRALALAGVTRETPDPPNGRIERDAAGNPSGTLRETAARLVSSHLPPHSDDDYAAGLDRAMRLAGRFGITTWHEANAGEAIARAYHHADSLGRLSVRTVVALGVSTDHGTEQIARLDSLRRRYTSPNVAIASAKIFADGVIEGHTGALLAPYLDRPGDTGFLNLPAERMDSLVHALDSAGFKVHVHAIGDRAIRVALDAFEKQRAIDNGAGPRHIIAHVQLFDTTDIPRFARNGVVASFQPLWAQRDSYMRDLTEPRLGPARSRWLYPIATMVRTGAIVAAGSDWSVSSLNPLEAIQVAMTRQTPGDTSDPVFLPEERIDLATAIRAYTLNGARASDDDQNIGTISRGKSADVIVLSDDLFTLPSNRISTARVLMTLLKGREVYRDSTWAIR